MSKVAKVAQSVEKLVGRAQDWAIELDNHIGSNEWRPSLEVFLKEIDSDVSIAELAVELNREGDALRAEVYKQVAVSFQAGKLSPVFESEPVKEPEPVLPDKPKRSRKKKEA